jgi:hypothetical protein
VSSSICASQLDQLAERLAPLRARLAAHPLYASIRTEADLRVFMQSHVFAVWDFMSLLKALQARLTCVVVPWTPTPLPESRRFVNEIVWGEESDLYQGRAVSHFELYLEAMQECGAETAPMRELLARLAVGAPFGEMPGRALGRMLGEIDAPPAASAFVASTFALIETDKVHALAAAFTFGREDLIPDLFRQLVRDLDARLAGRLGKFVWYLERHIEVDGEDHGPLSLRMVADLCGSNDALWAEAAEAAETAILARLALWDGILAELG